MSADPKTASRLENVCAMLASPNDGERANAALMATRMLNELGLDWRAFTQRALAGAKAAQCSSFHPRWARPSLYGARPPRRYAYPFRQSGRDWQDGDHELDRYLELLAWGGLTDWERGFVLSLYNRHPKPLTEKQCAILEKIIRKYKASQGVF